MTDANTPGGTRIIRLQRRFDAAIDDVFRAWTDPAEVALWYGPAGWHAPLGGIVIEPVVGGRWAVTMVRRSDGVEFPIGYEILDLVEPRRIVLRHANPAGGEPTLVTVELEPDGDGTILTLTDGPMRAEGHDPAEQGYVQAFEKLASALAQRDASAEDAG